MNNSSDVSVVAHGKDSRNTIQDAANGMDVYIWDMDETLLLLKSLLNGSYAAAFNGVKNMGKGKEIGKSWEKHILDVCDTFFFYEQIENHNEPCLNALREYDDGRDLSDYDFSNDGFGPPFNDLNKRRLAYRHRVIAEKYSKGLHTLLDQEMIKIWNDLYNLTDAYTDKWFSSARVLLEESCSRKVLAPKRNSAECTTETSDRGSQNVNVLVTSGSLVPSLVKCLLFRLDDLISHENVYSSWEVGKLQCFSSIKERFDGPNVRFCVIGDGFEECEAAETMKWPFIRIDMRPEGTHRFPGFTMKMLNYYMEVIYDTASSERDDDH